MDRLIASTIAKSRKALEKHVREGGDPGKRAKYFFTAQKK